MASQISEHLSVEYALRVVDAVIGLTPSQAAVKIGQEEVEV